MLKTALRASEALEKLADKPFLPPLPEGNPEVDERRLFRDLWRLREEAEEAGAVSKSPDIYWTIHHWKNALVGERPGFSLPSETAPGSVRAELARTILGGGEVQGSGVGSQESGVGVQGSGVGVQESGGGANVECRIQNAESDAPAPGPPSELAAPNPPKTHKRIFYGGHPPLEPKEPAGGATSERPTPCRQPPGCGRIVMIDPSTGKKYGAPPDDYGNDPLSLLYRRVEERMRREAAERRREGG
jgi:hypothetical protein